MKKILFLFLGTLVSVQGMYAGRFEDLWNDEQFQRELGGTASYAASLPNIFNPNAPDALSNLQITYAWVVAMHEKLKRYADLGEEGYQEKLQKVVGVRLQLNEHRKRYMGIRRHLYDHPWLTRAVFAGIMFYVARRLHGPLAALFAPRKKQQAPWYVIRIG